MVQRSKPPRPWSWVSHGTVPLRPVVWWGCGTVPLPPLWCGGVCVCVAGCVVQSSMVWWVW